MSDEAKNVVPMVPRKQHKKARGQKTSVMCVMTEPEIARLDRLAELTGLSARSEIIRVALVRMLREEERNVEKGA